MAGKPVKIIEQLISGTAHGPMHSEFAIYQGDCVEVLSGLPSDCVHYSIFSPPFGSLYSYTDALQDMSNVQTDAQFFAGLDFMIAQLARAIMPGRLVSFHCMNLPATLERDGYIGIKDFRGDLIRAFQKQGFIYHSEVVIWKDPLVAATRTHAIGLAHKQIVQDSALCRQGIPDYLVTMRKPGKNPEPVSHKPSGFGRWIGPPELEPKREKRTNHSVNKYSHEVWQRYASPVWFDINPSDTLQKTSARDDDDSRHICPLQLTVIRRAVELWTNPGDIVLSPFAGIGSEGYVALQEGRRFVGAELKDTYYRQACANLARAIPDKAQGELLPGPEEEIPAT
jgi:DNA modification methylase